MWNISFEKGRQVWEPRRDREQPVANETKDGRAVRTKEGIAYNGLPLMTDGVVHTHMLKDGAKGPTPLGKRDVTFDPRTVQSIYDSPKPLQEAPNKKEPCGSFLLRFLVFLRAVFLRITEEFAILIIKRAVRLFL